MAQHLLQTLAGPWQSGPKLLAPEFSSAEPQYNLLCHSLTCCCFNTTFRRLRALTLTTLGPPNILLALVELGIDTQALEGTSIADTGRLLNILLIEPPPDILAARMSGS